MLTCSHVQHACMLICSHIFRVLVLSCFHSWFSHACIFTCSHASMFTCLHTHIFTLLYVHMLAHICSYIWLLTWFHIHMFSCAYAYTSFWPSHDWLPFTSSHACTLIFHIFNYSHASIFTWSVVHMLIHPFDLHMIDCLSHDLSLTFYFICWHDRILRLRCMRTFT